MSSSDLIISNERDNSISSDEKTSRSNSILPYCFEKKDIEMSDLQIKLLDKIDIYDNSMSLDEAIQD